MSSTFKKVAVVTGSRAEYGLLKRLLRALDQHHAFHLQLLVTGEHLSQAHGGTIDEIIADGVPISETIDLGIKGDDPVQICSGLSIAAFSGAFSRLQSDYLIVLGDRFELLPAACAALIHRIPIFHIHGGEITNGAIDDSIRHVLTKMSKLHFVAAEPYRRRVIQMGETPDRVFTVGGMGTDAIAALDLPDPLKILEDLHLSIARKVMMVTLHPETVTPDKTETLCRSLIDALEHFATGSDAMNVIVTGTNSDPGGKDIAAQLKAFAAKYDTVIYEASLGQKRYLSLLAHAEVIVGNSSSGLLEAPSLRTPTVNIGLRQDGRLLADSVINCAPDARAIIEAIVDSGAAKHLEKVAIASNPYGDGNAVEKIISVLEAIDHAVPTNKSFYDLSAQLDV